MSATKETVTERADRPQLQRDLDRIRLLLETRPIREARACVGKLERRRPESERVKHFAQALQLPEVGPAMGRGRDRAKERAWLSSHAHEYPGCWLAVYEDRLLAASPDVA